MKRKTDEEMAAMAREMQTANPAASVYLTANKNHVISITLPKGPRS